MLSNRSDSKLMNSLISWFTDYVVIETIQGKKHTYNDHIRVIDPVMMSCSTIHSKDTAAKGMD